MKTRTFRASFFLAIGVALFAALFAALPQAAQAQAADIAVLHNKIANTDSTLKRIDERLERMDDKFTQKFERIDERFERLDERFDRFEEIVIRLDERMNALQSQNRYFFGPLLLLLLAALFALLTKGTLWGVAREPKAASGASRPAPIPPAQPHPS